MTLSVYLWLSVSHESKERCKHLTTILESRQSNLRLSYLECFFKVFYFSFLLVNDIKILEIVCMDLHILLPISCQDSKYCIATFFYIKGSWSDRLRISAVLRLLPPLSSQLVINKYEGKHVGASSKGKREHVLSSTRCISF